MGWEIRVREPAPERGEGEEIGGGDRWRDRARQRQRWGDRGRDRAPEVPGRDRRGHETATGRKRDPARQGEKGSPERFCHGEGQSYPRRERHATRRSRHAPGGEEAEDATKMIW